MIKEEKIEKLDKISVILDIICVVLNVILAILNFTDETKTKNGWFYLAAAVLWSASLGLNIFRRKKLKDVVEKIEEKKKNKKK